jgi:hypothetical protein
MDLSDVPACAVSIESQYAISIAHRYVELVEAQLSQAQSDLHSAALEDLRRIAEPDESDYDIYVADVQRRFEEDYRPILRYTEVIYLHMVFETFICRHIAEIEALRGKQREIVKELRKKNKCGIAEAARIYFQKEVPWSLLHDKEWVALCDITAVRNCIVHSGGVVLGFKGAKDIYRLVSQQTVGINFLRYDDGRDAGQPVTIQQSFIEYYLDLLKKLFDAIDAKTRAEYWNKPPKKK